METQTTPNGSGHSPSTDPMPLQPPSNWSSEVTDRGEHGRCHRSVDVGLDEGSEGSRVGHRFSSKAMKGKRKEEMVSTILCEWVVEHQLGLAINLLLLLFLTHLCFPRARRYTRKFSELSYYTADSGKYSLGWNDAFLVTYWIVIFTGLRVAAMDLVFIPFAQWGGVKKRKAQTRFAEQAWLLLYYTIFWSLGMYIYYNSSYWLNLHELWTNWPDRQMSGLSKWYYLVQFAYWLQQILVVNIEDRRKDYHQMFTHHVITCALVFASYGYHQTKVGTVILCLMDVVDLVLPLAKMLKYLHFQLACDIAFGVFLLAWFVARHALFLVVLWSTYAHLDMHIQAGCYDGRNGSIRGPFPPPDYFLHLVAPFRNPEGVICWNKEIKWGFITMLIALQILAMIWFIMILKVAWRVINGGTADDDRSDGEEEDAEEGEQEKKATRMGGLSHAFDKQAPMEQLPLDVPLMPGWDAQPFEEEVGIEDIHFHALKGRPLSNGTGQRRYKKVMTNSGSTSSGATLPGHSDRKELLGRIGCDKSGLD